MSITGNNLGDDRQQVRTRAMAHPRAVGSPLPRGGGLRQVAQPIIAAKPLPQPPSQALPGPPPATESDSGTPSSTVQKAVNLVRAAMPFVQRILPLIEGNFVAAAAQVLVPHPQKAAPQQQSQVPAPVHVNLAPLAESVTELQAQHVQLRDQVAEQNTSLKRVEDQLEMVREATDRNTLEQQELMEDLKAVGIKANWIALAALGLLLISLLLNLVLYMHIQRVLP